MATRDEMFPSKYLSGADLVGKPPQVVEIEAATQELLRDPKTNKDQKKLLLAFVGKQKMLVVNRVNWDAITYITGEFDSNNWPGHKIELFTREERVGAEMKDCVRVRAPSQGELKVKASQKKKAAMDDEVSSDKPDDNMNDNIPF